MLTSMAFEPWIAEARSTTAAGEDQAAPLEAVATRHDPIDEVLDWDDTPTDDPSPIYICILTLGLVLAALAGYAAGVHAMRMLFSAS